MKIFIMMVGIPASGKSWLRKKAFYDATVICPDDFIGYTKDRPWSVRSVKYAWQKSEGKFASLMSDGTDFVVFDATNTTAKHRRKYMKRAADAGFQTVAVLCDTPKNVCLERNGERDQHRQVPLETVEKMFAKLELPTLQEGFNLVAQIDQVNKIYTIYEASNCLCGDEIRERFKFLWGNAQHKSLMVIKR